MEGAPYTILTIDDEDAIRWSFASFLEDSGYNVLEAEDGQKGVEVFRKEKPDLVLVDLRMPGMGGLEVLSTISEESPDTPMIVVSGAGVARDAVNALKIGAWDYIFKPIENLSILLHTVKKNLERANLRKENKAYQENLEILVQERSEKLLEYSRRLKHIADCTLSFTASKTIDGLCHMLLKALVQNTEAGKGRLFLRAGEEMVLVCDSDGPAKECKVALPERDDSLLARLWKEGVGLVVDLNTDSFAPDDSLANGWEGDSLLAVPIKQPGGDVQGLALLGLKPGRRFTESDLELTAIIASHGMEALRDIHAAQALTASEERFRALTENSSDITLIIGPDLAYTYASPSVFSQYGYDPNIFIGNYPSRNIHPKDVSVMEEALERAIASPGKPIGLKEIRFKHRDGSWSWVEGVLNSQVDVPGVGGVVFSGRDITERRASEEKLRQAYEQLEKKNVELQHTHELLEAKARDLEISSMYKSQFLANVSHELRTPLNSIILLSGILTENRDDSLTEGDLECSRAIHSSGKALLSLINEVLDLSKVEAGKMEVHIGLLDLYDFIISMEREFNPLAKEKGLDFRVEMGKHLPRTINSDRQRLEQVLRNFLSNALKFTKRGSVILKVGRPSAKFSASLGGTGTGFGVCFSVQDTGIGIEKGKMEEIFDAFTQADGTTSREFGGTGLGLTISREIARLIGGAIHVESQPGKGSAFILVVPEVYTSPAETPIVKPWETMGEGGSPDSIIQDNGLEVNLEEGRFLAGKSILLADADMRHVFTLRKVFGDIGSRVVVARDPKEALDRVNRNPRLDLVLMGGSIVREDPLGIVKTIKEREDLRHVPVVALTADQSGEMEARLRKAGVQVSLPKPVNLRELFRAIKPWLTEQ